MSDRARSLFVRASGLEEKRILLPQPVSQHGQRDKDVISPTRFVPPRPARQLATRLAIATCCFLAGIVFATALGANLNTSDSPLHAASQWLRIVLYGQRCAASPVAAGAIVRPGRKSQILRTPTPQAHFRDALVPDVRYLTTLAYGGLSNQLYSLEHLLYLGHLLSRPVILPALASIAAHTPGARPIPMSDVIDLEYLQSQMELPFVEWSDLKPIGEVGADVGLPSVQQQDRYGCYSLQYEMFNQYADPATAIAFGSVIGYWPMVTQARRAAEGRLAGASYLEGLATWAMDHQAIDAAFEEERAIRAVNETNPLQLIEPDGQLLCIDNLFFPAPLGSDAIVPEEQYAKDLGGSRSWHVVGQHLRFTKTWEALAVDYLREIFDLPADADVPPFMAVHIRRGDFAQARGLTPLQRYMEAMTEVRRQLAHTERLDISPARHDRPAYLDWHHARSDPAGLRVLVATDEDDAEFLHQLRTELGWTVIDHASMRTQERHGPWASSVLDSVILSRAIGLVGTPWSTFSQWAGMRVRTWNRGIALDAEGW